MAHQNEIMFLSVRNHRHGNYNISPGLSLFLPEKRKINYDSNTVFLKILGWIISTKNANCLFLPLLLHPLFLSFDRIAHRQRTQCFLLNKPRVITEDLVCDQRKEARGTGKTWKG